MVYIDPPYNSRQYSDTYHLLDNLASWNKPDVFGKAKKWIDHIKSKYCSKDAWHEFQDLITKLNAKHIIVSYNNTENTYMEDQMPKYHLIKLKNLNEKG